LAGVTGGNGAIYAVRRDAYIQVDPRMGHDLSFPFNIVKRGLKPVYAPAALAEEKMVPTIGGEFRRKRRMQSHMWPIVLQGGLAAGGGHALSRLLDIAVASALLVLSSPLLIAALIAIRLESAGSPIYRQRRVGKGGEPFDLLKLRTMVSGAEHIGAGLAVNEG